MLLRMPQVLRPQRFSGARGPYLEFWIMLQPILNFLAAAMGKFGLDVNVAADVKEFASVDSLYLSAISIAAVFFGAMTYIGNAPNFMVKAIADSNNVDAPSFVGYLVKYGLTILLPVYALVWLVFYSGWVF